MKITKLLIKNGKLFRLHRCFHKPALVWDEPKEGKTMRYDMSQDDVFSVENHWRDKVNKPYKQKESKGKKYVLSMFPYPSGNLHMGHVRVYTIADCIARCFALKGYDVFQPIGWDAFGLPAENAAIERKENPSDWTKKNIETMKEQLKSLSCRFDWDCELATCDPNYYRWTQWIFLKLYEKGLAYRRKSYVNWDPMDMTVLASEQIDSEGRSWRSGALVEQKHLNQWFIKTTKFAKALYDNLDSLPDWKDIVAIQRNWLGQCHVHRFTLDLYDKNKQKIGDYADVCLKNPSDFGSGLFLILKHNNPLISIYPDRKLLVNNMEMLDIFAKNPINDQLMPIIIVNNDEIFEDHQLCKLGVPKLDSNDFSIYKQIFPDKEIPNSVEIDNETVLRKAEAENWGGHVSSYRLNDWVVSRQRYWGTPIPVIHCHQCGVVPVPESDLPVILPKIDDLNALLEKRRAKAASNGSGSSSTFAPVSPLDALDEWKRVTCTRCSGPANRETDTLDTFFDSSWYYLRYLDANNQNSIVRRELANHWMPVDIYVGGKEHACLHLFFARFMCHFLHSIGVSPVKEPFLRLMPQGMVMGQAYSNPKTGQYVHKSRVKILDDKTAVDGETNEPLEQSWEKMSKSKHNGVDPQAIFDQYGSDIARLLMVGFVCPQADRNWSTDGYKGVHRWLNRISYVVQNYVLERRKMLQVSGGKVDLAICQKSSDPVEKKLKEQYNRCVQKLTFHNQKTFLFNTALAELIVLTSALRKMPLEVYGNSPEFERCLHSLIIMCSPLMPHMAAEFWSALRLVPAIRPQLWDTEKEVWDQKWPEADEDALMQLVFTVEEDEPIDFVLFDRRKIDEISAEQTLQWASKSTKLKKFLAKRKILGVTLKKVEFLGIQAFLTIEPGPDEIGTAKKPKKSIESDESESDLKSEAASN